MRDLVSDHVVINALRAIAGISCPSPGGSRGNLDYVLLQRDRRTIAQAVARPLTGARPHHARLKLRGGIDARRLPVEVVDGLEITESGVVIVEERNIVQGVRLIEHLVQIHGAHRTTPTPAPGPGLDHSGSSPPAARSLELKGPRNSLDVRRTAEASTPSTLVNPWADLPKGPPFIVPADAEYMQRYPKQRDRLQLDFLPSPYLGKPDARVYLLLHNPGGRHNDFEYGSKFVEERRRALRFESSHSFWSLSPGMRGTPAFDYATEHMRVLIDAVGQERVAQRMMWLQYFGYQSLDFEPFPVYLPSQRFAFGLLRGAMDSGKVVIIGRRGLKQLWTAAVPELDDYDSIELRSPRRPWLTPPSRSRRGNMETSEFTRIVEALSE